MCWKDPMLHSFKLIIILGIFLHLHHQSIFFSLECVVFDLLQISLVCLVLLLLCVVKTVMVSHLLNALVINVLMFCLHRGRRDVLHVQLVLLQIGRLLRLLIKLIHHLVLALKLSILCIILQWHLLLLLLLIYLLVFRVLLGLLNVLTLVMIELLRLIRILWLLLIFKIRCLRLYWVVAILAELLAELVIMMAFLLSKLLMLLLEIISQYSSSCAGFSRFVRKVLLHLLMGLKVAILSWGFIGSNWYNWCPRHCVLMLLLMLSHHLSRS